MDKNLTVAQRMHDRKLARQYLSRIMDTSHDYRLYVPDVTNMLLVLLAENMFKDLPLAEQRKAASLYPENEEMSIFNLKAFLTQHGEDESVELFWKMVGEYVNGYFTVPEPDEGADIVFLYASGD